MLNYLKNAYHDHKDHIPDTIWHFLYTAGKQIFVFGTFALGFFLLSPYEFGLYNYLIAVFLIFVIFGDFGISAATSKYIAELKALGHEKEKAVLFNAFVIAFVTIGLVGIAALLLTPDILGEKRKYIYVLFPSLFFLPAAYLYAGVYRGIGRFKAAAIISLSVSTVSLVAAFFFIVHFGVYGALWANNFFSILLFCALALGYRDWHIKWDKALIKSIGSYSIVLGASSLSYYLFSRVDVLMLGYWGYIPEIGSYELINKSFLVLVAPFTIFAQVVAPTITSSFAKKNFKSVFSKFGQLASLCFFVGLILTFLVYWIAPYILSHVTTQYSDALFLSVLSIMLFSLPGQAVANVTAVAFSLATGHARLNMTILFIFWIINLPLTYFFIKYFGFIGAVYGTTLVTILTDITFVTAYYFVLKRHTIDNQ